MSDSALQLFPLHDCKPMKPSKAQWLAGTKEPESPKASSEESTRVHKSQSKTNCRHNKEGGGGDLLIPEPKCSACFTLIFALTVGTPKGGTNKTMCPMLCTLQPDCDSAV